MRKVPFIKNEYYHIYNRGVDKRLLFNDEYDFARFLECMDEFNVVEPIGSIYSLQYKTSADKKMKSDKLVEFVCYCVNPNHYHFLLREISEGGISEFMKRLNGGYTRYFNDRHNRTGSLFQGVFKSKHVGTNEYLLHGSCYINLNDKVHKIRDEAHKFVKSSWDEYTSSNSKEGFCNKDIILGQFKHIDEYKKFAESSLEGILEKRKSLGMEEEENEFKNNPLSNETSK